MKYLITGITGFLGPHLAKKVDKRGLRGLWISEN